MTNEARQYREVTILFVDDDDVDYLGLQRALSALRILNPVVRARDGLEALEMLRQPGRVPRPFLVLLDINMPRMSGLEMLATLRNDPELAATVVFILTTSKDEQDKVAAYRLNVAGYIVKNHISAGFSEVLGMLDHYWRVVELPNG